MLILLSVVIIVQIIDVSINNIYIFVNSQQFSRAWNTISFTVIVTTCLFGQYLILEYVKKNTKEILATKKLRISTIHKVVKIVHYMAGAVLLIVTIEIMLNLPYSTYMIVGLTWLIYSTSIFILGLLVVQFVYWYRSKRSIILLLYAMATGSIAITAALAVFTMSSLLIGTPPNVTQTAGSESPSPTDTILLLTNILIVASIVSFITTWIATVYILHHYSKTLGVVRYWLAVSVPLAYFLFQFQPIFIDIFSSYRLDEPILFGIIYTIVLSISRPVGGILFAIAFLTTARKVNNKQVRKYLIISAFGLALIYSSDQAVILANRPYPPFGLATISFMGLAAYTLLVGIYSTALSVAQDSRLRQSIRKSLEQQSEFMNVISAAEMEKQILSRVSNILAEQSESMERNSGISSSMDDAEIKKYLDDVVAELKKSRLHSTDE